MRPLSGIQINVKCDAPGCGWSQHVDATEVATWCGRECPQCAALDILTEYDLAVLASLIGLHVMGIAKIIDSGSGGENSIQIDTAAMRREWREDQP
jgi:hypothetical protein